MRLSDDSYSLFEHFPIFFPLASQDLLVLRVFVDCIHSVETRSQHQQILFKKFNDDGLHLEGWQVSVKCTETGLAE